MTQRFLLMLAIFLAFLTLFKPYFKQTFPYTHDGENHLARFANYKIALREGQLPPRFAPSLMNHYGYPAFNYNYPLANILSLPFSILGIHYELTFKMLIFVFWFLSFGFIWFWLKELGFAKSSVRLFALATFFTSHYLFSAVYFRGNIGEIMAITLLSGVLLSFHYLKKAKRLISGAYFFAVLVFSAFLLSHNVTVLFATPLLFIYAIYVFDKSIKDWLRLFVTGLQSIFLTLWFWLPAVFEKSEVLLDDNQLAQSYLEHFPSLRQLLFAPLEFGFSKTGNLDSLGFSIGLLQIIVLLFSFIFTMRYLAKKKAFNIKHSTLFFLVICLVLFALQLSFTKIIWEIVPLANFIQFPWRISLFLVVFLVPLAANLYTLANDKLKILLVVIIGIQLISLSKLNRVDEFHHEKAYYENFGQSTSTLNENLPKTFTYLNIGDWQPAPLLLTGQGTLTVERWNGSYRKYSVNAEEESIIVEPTMYFLGWQTRVISQDTLSTGQRANLLQSIQAVLGNYRGKISYIDNEEIAGRIAYKLPPGQYTIESRFTQRTWARILGNTVSISSFFGFILLWALQLLNKRKHVLS